ncbi:hypothetical protein BD410DRAFT_788621 [Rickenella mellea]|uniref:Uncharacterized protein n=1 Tax=Rickenella mellea TaxID=50990 RepID=A0A4Y7Q641_9AGAM|nr:hypothetical protein BD410DRAFT_788621 [Rickenella mellea]
MASTNHHRSRRSHIDCIPYELLAQIFELNRRAVKYPCAPPSKYQAPLVLLGVCRKWRHCALATRSLWSRLCIGRGPIRKRVGYATAAKAWLDRAGSTPLSIDLYYARHVDENRQDAMDHALQQVFTTARVWKVVYLEICGPPRAGSNCIDAILNTVLQSPALESFSFEIVHRCPNVEILHVSLRAPKHLVTRTTIHTLAKLHTLSVNAVIDHNHDVAEFLDALCTPSLAELTVDSNCNVRATESSRWPHLAHLLARSQPPLKSLTLLSTNLGGDDIISCLQHAPQLVILSGDGVVFGLQIMEALTPSAERAEIPMCPQLAMVSLKGPQRDVSALAAMIYARWTISRQKGKSGQNSLLSPVEVVEMSSDYRSLFLQCQGMAECEKHGLDLWFTRSVRVAM